MEITRREFAYGRFMETNRSDLWLAQTICSSGFESDQYLVYKERKNDDFESPGFSSQIGSFTQLV
jgi:hypothetical protein